MNSFFSKISRILFLGGFICSSLLFSGFGQGMSQKGVQYEYPKADNNMYLVEFILDSKFVGDQMIKQEIGKTLEYVKIPHNTIPLKKGNKLQLSPTTQVLVVGNIDRVENDRVKEIIDFVSKGGTLIMIYNGESEKFGFLAGVSFGSDYAYNTNAQGYDFQKNLFNNKTHHQFDDLEKHYGLAGSNFSNIEVWATAMDNPAFPAIFQHKLGNGKVIVFNTSKKAAKQHRGLFFAAIMSGLPQVPWPVNSTATIFLDDFVSPLYSIRREPVKSALSLNEHEFLTEVWWPDMAALANQEGIVYTTLTCFDYRNYTRPPFTFKEWDNNRVSSEDPTLRNASSRLLKELKESVHELGFHGYNHVSLLKEDWPSKDFMTLSVSSARKKWISENYGKLPFTYVPPSNVIDEVGLNALKAGMPSIGILASLYLQDFEEGQNREFDWDPWNPEIFDFPRISSGYVMYDNRYFNAQSTFLYTGIWNHFIHHDDIYQIPSGSGLGKGDFEYRNRDERLWKQTHSGEKALFEEFEEYIIKMKKDFPFADFISAKEASSRTIEWRRGNYRHERGGGLYQVAQTNPSGKNKERVWFTYVPIENADEMNSYLQEKRYAYHSIPWIDGFLYQIKTKSPQISIPDKTNNYAETEQNIATHILEGYERYRKGIPVFTDIGEELEYRIKKGEIHEAIRLLQAKIRKAPNFNRKDWQDFSTFMSWESRTPEVWKLLQDRYESASDPAIFQFSSDLGKTIGYPTEAIRKYWLPLQYESDPDNLEIKAEFITVFGIGKEVTDREILDLLNSNIEDRTKSDLVSRYLDEYPKKVYLFDKYQPCEDSFLLPHADRLAYIYSDSGHYEKALLWTKCSSGIPLKDEQEWRLMIGDYQFLKSEDFPRYIEFLLYQKPDEAIEELNTVAPRAIVASQNLNASIAYLYSDHNQLRKALEWSEFAEDFPILTQLQWEYDLQAYDAMDRRYDQYRSSPSSLNDPEVQLSMARWMVYRGEIERAWALTVTAEEGEERRSILTELSKNLRYQDLKTKKNLFDQYEDFVDPTYRNEMRRELIRETSGAISSKTRLEADRFETTGIYSDFLFSWRDKNFNTHSFGTTIYRGFGLNLPGDYPLNRRYEAYGAEYRFERAIRHDKANYSGKIGLEKGEGNNFLFHVQGDLHFSIDSLFSSFSVSYKPAETAPAHYLKIYQSSLNIYEELQIDNKYTMILFLQGKLYTQGGKYSQGLLQIARKWGLGKFQKLSPYLEGSGALGNQKFTGGYPYWAIDRRLYGGMGMRYTYENSSRKQKYRVEAGYFFDSYSSDFQRYGLEIQQPISPHFYLTAGAEFYTIKNFYNNNFQLGLVVYLH